MTLKDYILTYEKDGNILVNLYDYYEWYIKPLNKKWEHQSYYSTGMVLCFFPDHADVNPSMGSIKDKRLKGVRVCHCFGCGRTADVVRLHQIIQEQYHHRTLTEKEACIDLAGLFGVPIEEFDELADDDYEGKYIRNLHKIDTLQTHYTVREFSSGILNLRKEAQGGMVDLNKLNSESVKMIATVKQLYD